MLVEKKNSVSFLPITAHEKKATRGNLRYLFVYITNKQTKKQATKLFYRWQKKSFSFSLASIIFILFYNVEHIQQEEIWSERFEDIASVR